MSELVNNGRIKEVTEDMGMLKSISLENYKCFKKLDNFEVKPLTVLCGINSSGKSSILKSLLMLKQSFSSFSNSNSLSLNGDFTNNGMFSDVVYGGKGSLFNITNSFVITSNSYNTTQEKNTLKEINEIFKCSKNITFAKLDIELIIKSQKRKIISYGDNTIDNISISLTTNLNYNLIFEFSHIQDKKYNILVKGLPSIKKGQVELLDTICYFDGLKVVNLFYGAIRPSGQKIDEILSAIYTVFRIISLQYKDIYYISPLRSAPKRRYVIEQDIESIGIYGEYVPQVLEKYKENTGKINDTPINDLFSPKYSSIHLKTKESVNKWLEYFGINQLNIKPTDELLRLNIGAQNILDVGFGVSQALPIIVNGVILPCETTLLLEQPEVHLHPRMQMSMADLLIAISMAHKNVIIETHSDHIINRISRRMMENEYIRNNTVIKFIDRDSSNIPFIEDIEVDPIKGIITDNENFFREFTSETEKILFAGYNNKIGEK